MEQFPIRSFRPVESREDNTDQDRTVLRLCDGFLAFPTGALCSGPHWKSLWGIDDLPDRAATVLAGADATKAHFLTISRGAHVWVVVWSIALTKPIGFAYVTTGTPADFDLDSTTSVTVASTDNTVYRDKDGSAPWYASQVGSRVYFGNGVDANVQWKDGALVALGPSTPPASIYDPSRYAIPACTCFAMAGNKSVFASGNAAAPLRVWITHPPTATHPHNEGVYSLDTSFIDVTYSKATRVTALSAFQNYITAHTDAAPVNLFDVDGTGDGYKCVQAPSAAGASAPCQNAVRDTNGLASFYVGSDGEIYEDQAIRGGPYDKRPARYQDIVTRLASNGWNRDLVKPVAAATVHAVYDRHQALFWVFGEMSSYEGHMGVWAYNERNRSVAGPIRYPNAIASAVVANTPESTLVAVLTHSGEMLYANLSAIGETEEFLAEAEATPLGDDYAELESEPTPTAGISYVAMSSDNQKIAEVMLGGDFAERDILNDDETTLTSSSGIPLRSQPLEGLQVSMETPWERIVAGGAYTFTSFWNDAYVARLETGYMDFGDARLLKNYLELTMTWQRHSRAYVGVYVEVDGKLRRGKWRGLVFDKETHVTPINATGRRIRVRIVAVLFNSAPALLRDISIGWKPAGTI